jgi:hypothetical protein
LAVDLIFHHCPCALFGAFFLLETFFGSGTSLIQIGGQRHLLFKELGELYSMADPRQPRDATPKAILPNGAQMAAPVRRKDACKAGAVLAVHMAELCGAEEAKPKAAPWWTQMLSSRRKTRCNRIGYSCPATPT